MANLGKTLLIVNPVAQSGKGAEAGLLATELLNAAMADGTDSLEVIHTGAPKDAIGIAARAGGFDTVLALGGDGVIHETAIGLMSIPPADRPTLGLIPVGSGNDYARSLNISRDVKTAIRQNLEAPRRLVDVGCCNGVYFVETLSFGLDAAIALGTMERRKHTNKIDTALYFEVGIDQLLHHFDTYHYTMEIDGAHFEGDTKILAVQNGVTYGGGFRITPHAKLDDGLLDICVTEGEVSVLHGIYVFARVKDGKHLGRKEFIFHKGSDIRLRFDRRPPCQIDGEEHIADEYIIGVHHKALPVLYNASE